MPERICKMAHDYAGRPIKVGEKFHVDQKDIELMLTIGFIEPEDQSKAANSKDMITSPTTTYHNKAMTAKPKRGYQRKAI